MEKLNGKNRKEQILFLEIPSRTLHSQPSSSQEFVQIKIASTSTLTPQNVNFNLTLVKANASYANHSSKTKYSKKSLQLKLDFMNRSTIPDIEKMDSNLAP
ncbi:Zinc finger, RING-CH-type [Artemisia annua]|uniref:Zinc finger, RING-CH-type n=1 Tax=Artemisia annua TaxID=35608 RepID=A0A2U1LBL3_ARTAN|nr:Zinc finger, RING-CH-type [Artemisia annua]